MDYMEKGSFGRKLKKIITKLIGFSFLLVMAYIVSIYFYAGKAHKIIKADIQIEKARMENAIKTFKEKTGSYPDLIGKEDNLNTVIGQGGKYTFNIFYGGEKLYAIPENLKEGVERTNRIVTKRDNKGGWIYNSIKGEIAPNIDEKKY